MFDVYLKAMQGKCSIDTIKAIDLLQKGQTQTALLADLEQMYQRGMINRASITKNGQTDLVVWPTGVNKLYNPKTDFKISPPKRDEAVIKPTITPAAEPAVNETPTAEKKPTSLLSIAQFVFAYGKVTKDAIYKEFPVPEGRKNDYVYKLIWQLTKQQIISVQKADQAKNDVVTIGPQYENYLAKLQKKQPKGPVIDMPTADEYAIQPVSGSVELTSNITPSLDVCIQTLLNNLTDESSITIYKNKKIVFFDPNLRQSFEVKTENLNQLLSAIKILNDLAVPAFQ
jgi:hypothetical protein